MPTQAATSQVDLDFHVLTSTLTQLLMEERLDETLTLIGTVLAGEPEPVLHHLLAGVGCFLRQEYQQACDHMMQAQTHMAGQNVPAETSIYTQVLLEAQLLLPKRVRPAAQLGMDNLQANLAALKQVDPELADALDTCCASHTYSLLLDWHGLCFFKNQTKQLLQVAPSACESLDPLLNQRDPIGFGHVGSGQELRYCLARQKDFLHGMTRPHYVFEPDLTLMRLLLMLDDFSVHIANRGLILFAGPELERRVQAHFATLRYQPPSTLLGQVEYVEDLLQRLVRPAFGLHTADPVLAYYDSPKFQQRLEQIARGDVLPRILISTARWTTFLKHCAMDFKNAFDKIGCETYYLIEEDDVQVCSYSLHWKLLNEFRPDMVFMVSHARPSMSFLPKNLGMVGYIQDKCGPILNAPDLTNAVTQYDMFVCMFNEYSRFVQSKGVPADQTMVMPIGADESMFYRLDDEVSCDPRLQADVGFVKHGSAHIEVMWQRFQEQIRFMFQEPKLQQRILAVFDNLHRQTSLSDAGSTWYEDDMQEFVQQHLNDAAAPQLRQALAQATGRYHVEVYSAHWRCAFLEKLDQAGVELALYGKNWQEHARLAHLHRGAVDRSTELNTVYNRNKINLHIHHTATMHQRLSECGLAGGFMLVADHLKERDWLSARNYYQDGEELVFFADSRDLIEKCRYYLARPDERRAIAERMHQKALAEHTSLAGAKRVLQSWRQVLQRLT